MHVRVEWSALCGKGRWNIFSYEYLPYNLNSPIVGQQRQVTHMSDAQMSLLSLVSVGTDH
jgi:hypothetical protein